MTGADFFNGGQFLTKTFTLCMLTAADSRSAYFLPYEKAISLSWMLLSRRPAMAGLSGMQVRLSLLRVNTSVCIKVQFRTVRKPHSGPL